MNDRNKLTVKREELKNCYKLETERERERGREGGRLDRLRRVLIQ
jgi:hypothetical protein